MVDYETHYRLTCEQHQHFTADPALARAVADECRDRLHDDLLTLQPGTDRGVAS